MELHVIVLQNFWLNAPTNLKVKKILSTMQLSMKLGHLKYELSQLDYIGIKIATGRATKKEYAEEIARMNELAEEINQVNKQLEALKASEEK